jgi:hypothetical protein
MQVLNYYSIAHFFLWLLVARWAGIHWLTFLVLSVGWELLELVLPFEFAVESIGNKCADIIVNIFGFSLGLWSRKMPGPGLTHSDRS